MSLDLLEPFARLVTTTEAIEGLRDLFAAEEPLDDIAVRVAETAVAAIPFADAVSITVLSWPRPFTPAITAHTIAAMMLPIATNTPSIPFRLKTAASGALAQPVAAALPACTGRLGRWKSAVVNQRISLAHGMQQGRLETEQILRMSSVRTDTISGP
jgi:hypothetical protein